MPRHTARGIVVHAGQLLLMERWRAGRHYFSIPGGGIEPGETPEETVVREILEETGVRVTAERQVLEMRDGETCHYIFICSYKSGQPALAANSPEALEADANNRYKPGWVPLKRVKDVSLVYWEPLRQPLLDGLQKGFGESVVVVSPALNR